jgi:hypothetical protein
MVPLVFELKNAETRCTSIDYLSYSASRLVGASDYHCPLAVEVSRRVEYLFSHENLGGGLA